MESLTVEELVTQDSFLGDSVHFKDGVWWKRIKPFFFQPAFFFQPIHPYRSSPRYSRALIGYHHRVLDSKLGNAHFGILVNESVKTYSVDSLPAEERRIIRKYSKELTVRKIEDSNDLLTSGYDAYLSFQRRTNWGRAKSDYHVYSEWIRKSFGLSKRFFLGVYLNGRLIAYSNPHAVEGIAGLQIVISHSDYLKYYPNDLLFHALLTMSRNSPEVRMAYGGPASLKPSLDKFKMKYGFRIVHYPTYVWLNPFAKPFIKLLFHQKYRQLVGNRAEGE